VSLFLDQKPAQLEGQPGLASARWVELHTVPRRCGLGPATPATRFACTKGHVIKRPASG